MTSERKTASFPVVSGWYGHVLTAAIVAVRALQPNAQPMCEWSWWSWILMTVPVFLPLYLWATVGCLWAFGKIVVSAMDSLMSPSRRKGGPF